MEFSFVKVLEDEYAQCEMTFLKDYNRDVKECSEFYNKYVKPLLEENRKAGLELDDDFGGAMSAQRTKAFEDGFRACMQMMLECASDKGVSVL